MTSPGTTAPRRLVTRRRVVISVLLALSVAALYVAFTLHEETPAIRFRPRAVLVVSPSPGALELRQTTVFYELASPYEGALRLGGIDIPMDQLDPDQGLNRVSYTPGKGKEIESFEPGTQTATAIFWPRAEGRRSARLYTWRFTVH